MTILNRSISNGEYHNMTEQMKYGDSMVALLPHRAAELPFCISSKPPTQCCFFVFRFSLIFGYQRSTALYVASHAKLFARGVSLGEQEEGVERLAWWKNEWTPVES
jgi:hypothetical protein